MHPMNLGWLDVCLRVTDVSASREFYEKLGFQRVEGEDETGWAVMTNGEARIGLFEQQYMETEFSLNFRGGDIPGISRELTGNGISFHKAITGSPERGYSATLHDPDGHVI